MSTGQLLSCSIVLKILNQLLHVLQRNSVVIARPYTADTSMTLEALQKPFLCTSQKLLFLSIVATMDAEADIHAAPHTPVGNNPVHLGVLVQGGVDELRLAIGNFLLAAHLLCTELAHKIGHDLASNPEVENGERVVERVVLGDCCVVEHDGTGHTTDVQSMEQRCGRRRCLWRKKVFAHNGDGDARDTDVLLCATLYILSVEHKS